MNLLMNLKESMEKKVLMKNNLTTSVVMATYNGEAYLEQQIGSIIKQSQLPNEIIFVDDGSTDNTVRIISSFLDTLKGKKINTIVIEQEENVGYIKNFMVGIKNASQDIIFLSDQDDLWNTQKLENLTLLFQENDDMLAVHSNTDIIDSSNNIILKNFQEYDKQLEKINLKTFIKKVNYPGMALAFRNPGLKSDILNKQIVELAPTHDWYICLLACLKDGFYITNQTLTYRRHTGTNVALKLPSGKKNNSIRDRIIGIELYETYYRFLREVFSNTTHSDNIKIEKYILNSQIRKDYLNIKSSSKALKNIKNINYYPSYKSYLGDLILLKKKMKKRGKK